MLVEWKRRGSRASAVRVGGVCFLNVEGVDVDDMSRRYRGQ